MITPKRDTSLLIVTTGISVLTLFSFIQVYGADYELISKWGSFGSGNGLFNQPAGIAVSPLDDDFYVADSLNNRIQKFFADGPFITKWGTVGQGNGQNEHNFTIRLSSLSNFTNISAIQQQQALSPELNSTSPLSIANTMRNANASSPTPGKYPYIATNKNYVFSQNKTEISSPSNNSHTGDFSKGIKIAVVMPTFTAAAYDKFYSFYQKYIDTPYGVNITTGLNSLSAKVTNAPSSSASGFAMLYLLGNLKWISPESDITFLTDQDVDAGSIFLSNGSNAYDLLILGHQEYVTQNEYDNLKGFVSTGGTMIILDGNVFYVEVKYDRNTGDITLVKGHSWAFNGISAWRSIGERWRNETAQWVGSNYISFPRATFVNDPFAYSPHEEQYLTNPNDIILLNYNVTVPVDNTTIPSRQVIATYELNYLKGKIIALGIYSDDIITNGSFSRYFDNLLLHYALLARD